MKSYSTDQIPLMEKDPNEPVYFCHIFLAGETLYFSDRNFKFNGHTYEAYLFDIPEAALCIERFGGYRNLSAQLTFRNERFRSYVKLFDFFLDNPITRREMDIYILYLNNGIIPSTDVSTLLHRVAFGEPGEIDSEVFAWEIFSILHTIDARKLFTKINRTNWPNAGANAIGKFENHWIGKLKNVPCHCIDGGAVSTLAQDLTATGTTIYLTDVQSPKAFPASGSVQIGFETITYTAKSLADNSLIGCTRGQIAKEYKAGESVAEIKATYKFLAMTGIMKAITNVYAGGVLVPVADRTVTLNDSGKSTITFTSKNLIKSWGAHSHGMASSEPFHPTGGTFTADSGMGATGIAAYLYDQNESTCCAVGVTGVTASAKDAYFTVTFPAYTGAEPKAVYACWTGTFSIGFLAGEYFRITAPETLDIGGNRVKLSGTTPPTTLTFRAHTNQGTPTNPCYLIVQDFEMWLELEYDMATRGDPKVWDSIAAAITCDSEGYPDDGSGTYTGVASALIENPSDVIRFILVGLLGRSMAEIGASFATIRSLLAGQTLNGYKFGAILSGMGASPADVVLNFVRQAGLDLREDGGKFELGFKGMPYSLSWSGDLFTGGTASASSAYGGNAAANAVDNNEASGWLPNGYGGGHWWKYDCGVGVTHAMNKLRMLTTRSASAGNRIKDFMIYGSNNDATWTLITTLYHGDNDNWEEWNFLNDTVYRYVLIVIVSVWDYPPYGILWPRMMEIEIKKATKSAGSGPSSVMTIDDTIFSGKLRFGFTPASEIKNLIRVRYNKDWSGLGKIARFGDFIDEMERSDATSITKYGELPEDIDLSAIYLADMAQDITDNHLMQRKDIIPTVSLMCNRMVNKLERGDHFTLNDTGVAAWEGDLWKVMEINAVSGEQKFQIQAIKYVSS